MNLPNLKEAKKRTNEEVKYIIDDNKYETILVDKKYYLKTYGCQMNVHDSEEIKARLERLGASETEVFDEADIIILNTCAIRENAHDKVFGFLGRCKHLKMTKPDLIIGICGCMAQEENVVNNIMNKYPYVNIVFGTHNIHELEKMLINNHHNQDINVLSIEGNVIEHDLYKRDSKYTAWVNIMYGCDKFCTYCIVPYTRGKQRSRKSVDIIKEVEELVKNGYLEVTLLGQNVNAYGKDLENEISFAKLLENVSLTGIKRVRFVTSHPWDFSQDMIDIIYKYDNIMPYIHLPLQSGSDRILKLMGRRYTSHDYLVLLDNIKSTIPRVAITTDIIVGFPGETEEDFQHTLDMAELIKYDGAYTFVYSKREGTPASIMADNVSLEEKNERLYRLNEVINKYALECNQAYINQVVPVLIFGISEKDNTKVCGYTDTMKLVNVDAPVSTIGTIINVLITEAKSFSLDGIEKK